MTANALTKLTQVKRLGLSTPQSRICPLVYSRLCINDLRRPIPRDRDRKRREINASDRKWLRNGYASLPDNHSGSWCLLNDGRLIVNPGSVGLQAYEGDRPFPHRVEVGSPHARYAVIENLHGGWGADLIAVRYDWETAAQCSEARGRMDWARAPRTGRV